MGFQLPESLNHVIPIGLEDQSQALIQLKLNVFVSLRFWQP